MRYYAVHMWLHVDLISHVGYHSLSTQIVGVPALLLQSSH